MISIGLFFGDLLVEVSQPPPVAHYHPTCLHESLLSHPAFVPLPLGEKLKASGFDNALILLRQVQHLFFCSAFAESLVVSHCRLLSLFCHQKLKKLLVCMAASSSWLVPTLFSLGKQFSQPAGLCLPFSFWCLKAQLPTVESSTIASLTRFPSLRNSEKYAWSYWGNFS